MRILMLAQFYAPIIGGEENYTRMLSTQLAARGHQVAVATVWHAGMPEFEVDEGVRIYRLQGTMGRVSGLFSEATRRHAPPFPDPELLLGLQRVVAREQPEIVHAHNWLGYQYLPLKTFGRAKLILHLHDISLVCAKKSFIYMNREVCSGPAPLKCASCASEHYGTGKGLMTLLGSAVMSSVERRMVDLFMPVSQAAAEENRLVGSGLPYRVMHNFMPDDITRPSGDYSSYLAQLPSEPYLLFVGALRKLKGIEVLLKAYADLRDAPPLVLIGYVGTDTPKEFPAGVTVLKNWPHGAVMAAWERALFGVLPSIWFDSFPLVMLEAMVQGRPVVASRIGGMPEGVLDGETGLLVPPGDEVALREAMRRLLDDVELRERMGHAARRHAENFKASAVIPRIEQVYRELIQDGQAEGVQLGELSELSEQGNVSV